MLRLLLIALVAALPILAQLPSNPTPSEKTPPMRLPDGRLQSEVILEAEHAQTLKDLEEMKKLLSEIEAALEKNNRHVLSLPSLKKLEEIEKRARKIRSRMTRN
ncbi:MAG: hypothetical protein NTV70_22975 [Acidobacteria bacterium]|nr:hypothetical protein [Acidobacteriota bacterium]